MSDDSSNFDDSKKRYFILIIIFILGCAKIKVTISLILTFIIISLAIFFAIIISVCCLSNEWKILKQFNDIDQPEFYEHGAVAADHVYCSKIGTSILKKNGSAVDAAIASGICLGIVNMHSSGIGGGGVMVTFTPNNSNILNYTIDYYDFRETAPKNIKNYLNNMTHNEMKLGPLSIAVPGEIHGYFTAWKEHGKLKWSELIEPSLELLKFGMPLHKRLYEAANFMIIYILNDPDLLCQSGTNQTLKKNAIFTNEPLYDTLNIIKKDPMSFYTGNLSKIIVNEIKNYGGIINEEDLASYKTIKRTPVVYDINSETKLYTAGAPFSGDLLVFMLNILKNYNWTKNILQDEIQTADMYHKLIETMKFAFALRNYYSDPDFSKIDLQKFSEKILSKNFTNIIYKKITNITHNPEYYIDAVNITVDHGTTHVSVLAPDGSAASLTSSINIWFGSGYRSQKLGIIFNNQIDDFSFSNHTNAFNLRPSKNNMVEPKKRPFSSMIPTIITKNNKFYMAIGGSGGTRITTSVLSTIFYNIWMGDNLTQSILRPRLHHQLQPNAVVVDKMFSPSNKTLDELIKKHNHKIVYVHIPEYSAVQGVLKKDDKIYAKSDPRKYGEAIGF